MSKQSFDLGSIDLGKLGAPEGYENILPPAPKSKEGGEADSSGKKGEAGDDADDLPDISSLIPGMADTDNTEEEEGEGEEEGTDGDDVEGAGEGKAGDDKKKPSTAAKGLGKQLGGILSQVLGTEVELPDDNLGLVKKLRETLQPKLHPEVVEYQRAIESGMEPDAYFKQRGLVNELLSVDDDGDLMTRYYRSRYGVSKANPKGWSDEKIKDTISKLDSSGQLAIQAEEFRENLRKMEADRQNRLKSYESGVEADPKERQKQVEKFMSQLDAAVDDMAKDKKLYGIELGKAGSSDALKKSVRAWYQPDESGHTKLQKFMATNNAAARLALLLHIAESGALEGALHDKATQEKLFLMKKLDRKPRPAGGSPGGKGSAQNVLANLMKPEAFK